MKRLQDGTNLTDHTVDMPSGDVLPGFYVRSAFGTHIGYVWLADGAWQWRSPTGNHYGERVTKLAAVEALRDAYGVALKARRPGQVIDPRTFAPYREPGTAPKAPKAERAAAPPKAPKPVKQEIVWGNEASAPGLADSITAAFKKVGAK